MQLQRDVETPKAVTRETEWIYASPDNRVRKGPSVEAHIQAKAKDKPREAITLAALSWPLSRLVDCV